MRKITKVKIGFIFIFILITTSLIYISFKDTSALKSSESIDERLAPNSNNIGLGMYGDDNKIIDNGSVLNGKDGKIHSKLSLSNYIKNGRDYKLIVLNNFKQVFFEVEGKKNKSYDFHAKPNTTIDIDVTNVISKDTKEVGYLIIKKPNFLLEKFDLQAISLQQVLPLRYAIKNKDIPFHESISPLFTTNGGPIDTVFISEKKDELNALTSAKSGQNVYLTVGNIGGEVVQYALIALLDWQQVPLIDNQFVHYVSVNPNEKKIFKLRLPDVNTQKNYQILAFPLPYGVSATNYNSQFIEASIRTVIQP